MLNIDNNNIYDLLMFMFFVFYRLFDMFTPFVSLTKTLTCSHQ